MPSPPRASILTPPGRGAVATVRIVGQGAAAMVAECFFSRSRNTGPAFPLDQIGYGRWEGPGGEEVVVCRRPPDDEAIDIHCHGGAAAVRAILQSLAQRGAVEVTSGGRESLSWRPTADELQSIIRREGDSRSLHIASLPITLEAQQALAQAPTLRTAAILLDQWAGALSREVTLIEQLLAAGDNDQAIARLRALLQRATVGLHLTIPWRVVLAGWPNVGKSSLINALLGYRRSIVFDQPGTTRDIVTAPAALDGWPVELTDTAGLRAARQGDGDSLADKLEAAGIAKALDQIAAADLLVLVLDGTQPLDADADILHRCPEGLVVLNKCDLPMANRADASQLSLRSSLLRTSAVTGDGIEALGRQIAARLVPEAPSPGAAVPFTLRQSELLRSALAAGARGAVGAARSSLQGILAGIDP